MCIYDTLMQQQKLLQIVVEHSRRGVGKFCGMYADGCKVAECTYGIAPPSRFRDKYTRKSKGRSKAVACMGTCYATTVCSASRSFARGPDKYQVFYYLTRLWTLCVLMRVMHTPYLAIYLVRWSSF